LKANQDSTIAGCKFDFSSVLTDVKTMSAVARVVEQVGVSAFCESQDRAARNAVTDVARNSSVGAAALVSDRSILGAAATILTTEARHQSLLNTLNGGTGVPQAFDQALSPQQVLALASPFISGCDFGIPGMWRIPAH
jgi:Ferritin-like domain